MATSRRGRASGRSWAGAGSQLLYVLMGAVGLPFYAGGAGGWEAATGATAGYLVGFVVAAWIVGLLAEKGQDRRVWSALPAFLSGTVVIYLFGITWLWYSVDAIATIDEALIAGMVPFVVGDLLKIALAGLLLPAAWKLVERSSAP